MNSAANTAYPCRKATCCGEDDPFPNFTQSRIGYNSTRLEAVQCVDYFTPPLNPPGVTPILVDPCLACMQECINEVDAVTGECGETYTSEAYLCALNLAKACCGEPVPDAEPDPEPPPPPTQYCNTAQTCTYACPDGSTFTYVLPAGTICMASQVEADAAAYNVACLNALATRFCFIDTPEPYCCVGNVYVDYLTLTASPGVFLWSIIYGTLPPGLTMGTSQTNTQTISGTPTLHGTWTFIIRVTNLAGQSVDKLFTMYAIEIDTATLDDAIIGTPYSKQLTAHGYPVGATLSWAITDGALPDGLTLSTDGLISGTPTAGLPATFTVGVTVT